jgi:hypothetical protein
MTTHTIAPHPGELEKEICFFKKILKWDWVKFCSLSLTKFNLTHLKSFFKTKFPFQALTMGDNHLNNRGRNTIVW